MTNSDLRAIGQASQWLSNHGLYTREEIMDLAKAAEDGDFDAEGTLRDAADHYNIPWEGDILAMAERIAGLIDTETDDDNLGDDFE